MKKAVNPLNQNPKIQRLPPFLMNDFPFAGAAGNDGPLPTYLHKQENPALAAGRNPVPAH